jgi:hypothetical protein
MGGGDANHRDVRIIQPRISGKGEEEEGMVVFYVLAHNLGRTIFQRSGARVA